MKPVGFLQGQPSMQKFVTHQLNFSLRTACFRKGTNQSLEVAGFSIENEIC